MALFDIRFYSESFGMQTSCSVIMPEKIQQPLPKLFLLHGLGDDCNSWVLNTSLCEYAQKYQLAIFMPQVFRCYYTDMYYGENSWTFIAQEFPLIVQNWFNLSPKAHDTFVAGLSMGGYGALKLGFHFPERFAAVAALSSAVFPDQIRKRKMSTYDKSYYNRVFGPENKFNGSENDLISLANQAQQKGKTPKILQICGTEDFLYQDNIEFRDFMKQRTFDYTFLESKGEHNWEFWNLWIQYILQWLPI